MSWKGGGARCFPSLPQTAASPAPAAFFAASGSDFMELFVGQGAKSVRELFQAARQAAPAVIFIDELGQG